MKQNRFLFVLPWLAFAPVTTLAGDKDDLEATMTVLDAPSDLDESMRRVATPDVRDAEDADRQSADQSDASGGEDDGFELDAVHDDDELEHEDDFEEGETIDDDSVE